MTNTNEYPATNEGIRTDGHDVDRLKAERLEDAYATVSQYVDVATLNPNLRVDMLDLAAEKARRAGRKFDAATRRMATRNFRNRFRDLCKPFGDFILGDVTLDLAGTYTPWSYLAPDLPTIVFVALGDEDEAIQSFKPDEWGRIEAIAVYFDPKVAGSYPYIPQSGKDQTSEEKLTAWSESGEFEMTVNRDGDLAVMRPKRFSPKGYLGICGMFADLDDADEAKDQLWQAVRQAQTCFRDSSYQDDPVRTAGIEQHFDDGLTGL